MDITQTFATIQPRYPEFKNQVALVTGSSRGIGTGIALRLAREGMKIVIHGADSTEVSETVQAFQALGVDVLGIAADFTDDDAISQLFAATLRRFDGLDVLVNNAADLRRGELADAGRELLDQQLAVNLRAPYLCSWHAAEIMQKVKRGSIINISSVGGLRAHWRGLPYDMTKGGLDAMTRALALSVARAGIRVNAIAPGAIRGARTPPPDDERAQAQIGRIPISRYGTALDIGAAVAFLASDDASYITGQILYVDGGITAQLSPPGQPI